MSIVGRAACILAVCFVIAGCSDTPEASSNATTKPSVKSLTEAPDANSSGVRYVEASQEANRQATDFLMNMLENSDRREDLLEGSAKAIICGPGLWNTIRKVAPAEVLDATKATFVIPNTSTGDAQFLDGRVVKTREQKIAFWDIFQTVLDVQRVETPDAVYVRKANEDELNYYWSIIPYESIEEPFWVVEINDLRFLFHFLEEDGAQKVFTVDVVQVRSQAAGADALKQ